MSRLITTVSTTEINRDISRQPGMKRTCARLPGCLLKNATVQWSATNRLRRPGYA